MSFLDSLLSYYSLNQQQYEGLITKPSFSLLPTLNEDPSAKKAKDRILLAISNQEKILVYGDYDVDGISSCSIIVKAIKELGGDVKGYLPSRYLDGYGFNLDNYQQIKEAGYSLIILTDNGATAFEPLEAAFQNKSDVIIIDHHQLSDKLPLCYALIHPDICSVSNVPISAGFLSFIFSRFLLDRDDPYLCFLGALSTISDMMPLTGNNRDVVKLGISLMKEENFLPFALLLQGNPINERTLAMNVIPSLNAVGRLFEGKEINRLLPFFLMESPSMESVANWILETNSRRKAITKDAATTLTINEEDSGIVTISPLPEGCSGLLANRLLSAYKKPVCVFAPSFKDPNILVGSMRSREGFNVIEALKGSSAPLLTYGGHALAGGLSIKKEDYDSFVKGFEKAALFHPLVEQNVKSIPLSIKDATLENYKLLQTLSPFGMGWEEPSFLIGPLNRESLSYAKDGLYISTRLSPSARLFSFYLGEKDLKKGRAFSFYVKMTENNYRGKTTLDLLAESALLN